MTVGLDEVGRGALAGPLLVGAVGLAHQGVITELLSACKLLELKDSKKLTKLQRERIFTWFEAQSYWTVGQVDSREIDELGLTKAVTLAAERALRAMEAQGVEITAIRADAGLVHGREALIPSERIVKGDETVPEISLASIMAKVSRDRLLADLDKQFPQYGLAQHVGYGTKGHYAAIKERGLLSIHRRLFLRGLVR